MANFNRFGDINSTTERMKVIWKATDETLNNDAGIQDDDDLTIALTSGDKYYFEFVVFYDTNASADFKCDIEYSGTESIYYMAEYGGPDRPTHIREEVYTTIGQDFTLTEEGSATETKSCIRLTGVILPTSNGTFRFRWAQSSAHASDTKVLAGSRLMIEKFA
jgi:hypothetical protein